ncbi:MAG TPA: SRPBCC domain-containing protein [Pyrinomonadaceae bacterium]|nr:SRPBCC domain-containing protein [Pyrinomonadaceae bacterium]
MNTSLIPPIKRSIFVSWDQQTAFNRFTAEFDSWWPTHSHSVGGDRVRKLVFETHVGGSIYEEHRDGRRFQWGQILAWEPPRRLKFTWHPSRDPSTAQDVEIAFLAEDSGTRLELTSTGWERWGRRARMARRGYDTGWGYILDVWAGKRTVRMSALEVVTSTLNLGMKLFGGRAAEIARAKGQMPTLSAKD